MYTSIISCDELSSLIDSENTVVIDTRFSLQDKEEGRRLYFENHIPEAFYAHLDEDLSGEIISGKTGRHPWPTMEKMIRLFSNWGINEDSQVVVYDQHHGGIAARLWALLLSCGHENVAVLNGGWKKWITENFRGSTTIPELKQGDFKTKPPLIALANYDDLRNYDCLIDARAEERYLGLNEPIDPIAGHIPNAVNFPFLDNLDANFEWLPKESLLERFANMDKDKSIAMYCGSGVTACHNIIAMKVAGLELPTLYAGSWSEYILHSSQFLS